MATTTLSPTPVQRFTDNAGAPLAFGQLFTYAAGTATPLATYTDSTGTTQNTNPIILDASGACNLWIPPNIAYKYVLAYSTDSNPPTNPIRTTDQIVNAQLITLYGGVDTGIANAYVLNFIANYPAYQDGIVIYWIPANTNTGPSTMNVNGFGVVAIKNANGSAITPGQIGANQPATIIYKAGGFILLSSAPLFGDGTSATPSIAFTNDATTGFYHAAGAPGVIGIALQGVSLGTGIATGSFTASMTGYASPPTPTIIWQIFGRQVMWKFGPAATGTSNSTSLAITNVPTGLRPANSTFPTSPILCALDSGNPTIATFQMTGSSTFQFWAGAAPSTTGWTNTGTKGFETGTVLTYSL